jgi:hypothetical protein
VTPDQFEQRRWIGVSRIAGKRAGLEHKRRAAEIEVRRIEVEAIRVRAKKRQALMARRRGYVEALAGPRREALRSDLKSAAPAKTTVNCASG